MALASSITRRIRNLIPDTEPIYGTNGTDYMFTDQAIEDFYTEGYSNVKWAAGLAKMTIGSSEALILKVIKNYETSTDGASLMKQWVAAGEKLIEQGKVEVAEAGGDSFDIYFTDEPDPFYEGANRPIGYPLHIAPPWT